MARTWLKEASDKSVEIAFEGKISSNRCTEVERALLGLRRENPQGHLMLDFENVEPFSGERPA